jgi:hypothetical protein
MTTAIGSTFRDERRRADGGFGGGVENKSQIRNGV